MMKLVFKCLTCFWLGVNYALNRKDLEYYRTKINKIYGVDEKILRGFGLGSSVNSFYTLHDLIKNYLSKNKLYFVINGIGTCCLIIVFCDINSLPYYYLIKYVAVFFVVKNLFLGLLKLISVLNYFLWFFCSKTCIFDFIDDLLGKSFFVLGFILFSLLNIIFCILSVILQIVIFEQYLSDITSSILKKEGISLKKFITELFLGSEVKVGLPIIAGCFFSIVLFLHGFNYFISYF